MVCHAKACLRVGRSGGAPYPASPVTRVLRKWAEVEREEPTWGMKGARVQPCRQERSLTSENPLPIHRVFLQWSPAAAPSAQAAPGDPISSFTIRLMFTTTAVINS